MYIPFEEIVPEARVWIYLADRHLVAEEVDWLKKAATSFCAQWAAHNQQLVSSFRICYDQFLILAVDEKASSISGCSIDSSIHFINQAQSKLGVDFLDRNNVAYLNDTHVVVEKFQHMKEKIRKGEITKQTNTFNNLVATKSELSQNWQLPVGKSWLKKFFIE